MTIPTIDDLLPMDSSFLGQPFVEGASKSILDLTTMDYSFLGQPFVRNPSPVVPPAGMGQVI